MSVGICEFSEAAFATIDNPVAAFDLADAEGDAK
jgi:hypothetical protein